MIGGRVGGNARAMQPPAMFVPILTRHRLLLLAILGGYAAAVFAGIVTTARPHAGLVAAAFCLALIVQFWPLLSVKPEYGWFHPLVFTSVALSLPLLRSFPTYAFGLEWNAGLPGLSQPQLDQLVIYGLLLTAASRASYYLGFFLAKERPARRIVWRPARRTALTAAAIAVGAAAVITFHLFRQGGIREYLTLLSLGRSTLVEENLLFGEWAVVAELGALACVAWWAVGTNVERNVFFWLLAPVSLALLHIETGSRSAVVELILLGWIIHVLKRRRLRVLSLGGVFAMALILLGVLGAARVASRSGSLSYGELAEGTAAEYAAMGTDELVLRAGPLNALYPILARVPADVKLEQGRSYVALAVWWVPRRLWPGKPRTTGAVVGETFMNTNAPVPPGAIGEAYWNFHIPGVIAAFFLLGRLHRWLMRWLVRSSGAAPALLLYAVVLLKSSPDVLSLIQLAHLLAGLSCVLILLGVFPAWRARVTASSLVVPVPRGA